MKKTKIFKLFMILAIALLTQGICFCIVSTQSKNSYNQSPSKGLGYVPSATESVDLNEYALKTADFNLTGATIPDNYNMSDEISINVGDQKLYGICYAFSENTVLETTIAKKYNQYYNFSEIYMDTALAVKEGKTVSFTDGGNFGDLYAFISSGYGPVLEEDMAFDDYYATPYSSLYRSCITKATTDFYKIYDSRYNFLQIDKYISFPSVKGNNKSANYPELNTYRNSIKNHLMTYGAISSAVCADNLTMTNYNLYTKNGSNKQVNHMITIVGWDDNYTQTGWDTTGAYLCLNSWGTEFGNNGYFYCAYDDYFVESSLFGIEEINITTPSSVYTDNYAEDFKTNLSSWTYTFGGVMANIIDVSNNIDYSMKSLDVSILDGNFDVYIGFCNTNPGNNISSYYINYTKRTFTSTQYAFYQKLNFSTPINITGKYMVVVIDCDGSTTYIMDFFDVPTSNSSIETKTYVGNSLKSLSGANLVLSNYVSSENTYFYLGYRAYFTKAPYISQFDSNYKYYTENGHHAFKNYAGYNREFNITFNDIDLSVDDIKIFSTLKNGKINNTTNFQISINSNKITIKAINNSLTSNYYLICYKGQYYNAFYLNNGITYDIDYELNGGKNVDSPTQYSDSTETITLGKAEKTGYEFMGWYLSSDFSGVVYKAYNNFNITSNDGLKFYAKWQLEKPTISVSTQESFIEIEYGNNFQIQILGFHTLSSEYSVVFKWYYSDNDTNYTMVANKTFAPGEQLISIYNIKDIDQTGYYYCKISISDGTEEQSIQSQKYQVKVNKITIDESKLIWSDSENPLYYNAENQEVKITNLPTGINVSYVNNIAKNSGKYTAVAHFSDYDTSIYNTINDISHEYTINKNKITIKMDNIYTTANPMEETLTYTVSGRIYNDEISITPTLNTTTNPYIYDISASFTNNNNYEVSVIDAKLKVITKSLKFESEAITANVNSVNGFIYDDELNVKEINSSELTNTVINELKDAKCDIKNIYTLSVDTDDTGIITVELNNVDIPKNMVLYSIVDGHIYKVNNCQITENGIKFTTDELGTFIICSKKDNTQIKMVYTIIVCILALFIVIYITIRIKHSKSNFRHRV